MFGWFSEARICASRSNRASRSGSVANESRQDLDRDVAIEPRVARPIDLTHAAVADLGGDFVGAEARAGGEGQSGVIIEVERPAGAIGPA